ncbi:hypothetical protein [Tunicatimonas pelagia]|uniref:hypothetical protein n=1 Tax=Tunicatimonas pelagia TaxID=931531 RepID=UPI0026670C06|nr:hypothetical protein [Tunicatimonas pelagia]WKN45501.1 hypothetical protein P0M28_11090 [Tunicatimonas pelagia]
MQNLTLSLRLILLSCFFLIVISSCSIEELNPTVRVENSSAQRGTLASVSEADFLLPGQDAQGWTVLSPSADSRIIYVNATTGNDATSVVYKSDDSAIGSDPSQPTGAIKPFRTIAAAYGQMRNGKPDWMLLARGEEWEESLKLTDGRSGTERSVFSAYGSGKRPLLKTGTKAGIKTFRPNRVIVASLYFWAHTRDTQSTEFVSHEGKRGFDFLSDEDEDIEDVLIEDCVFMAYKENTIQDRLDPGKPMKRIAIRRSIIAWSYSTDSHSSGIFYKGSARSKTVPSLLLEENLFDHNGWATQSINGDDNRANGQATMYNHNIYFSSANNIIVRGNLFFRASSIGNKWRSDSWGKSRHLLIKNNLYYDNEVAISLGGNTDNPLRFHSVEVLDNVILSNGLSRPTNRALSWGVDASDIKNGIFDNNIVAHQRNLELRSTYGFRLKPGSKMANVTFSNNVVYNIMREGFLSPDNSLGLITVEKNSNLKNVRIVNNDLILGENSSLVTLNLKAAGVTLANNSYSCSPDDNQANACLNYFGELYTLDVWQGKVEPTANYTSTTPDMNRDLTEYATTMGLGSATEELIEKMYEQSKANWNTALTAPEINQWIREGFENNIGEEQYQK